MSYTLCIQPRQRVTLSTSEKERLLTRFQEETNLDGPCELTPCTDDEDEDLLLLKLPPTKDEVARAYPLIVGFAQRHQLVIFDPQEGAEIDLDNPGAFPPFYLPKPKTAPTARRWFHWWK